MTTSPRPLGGGDYTLGMNLLRTGALVTLLLLAGCTITLRDEPAVPLRPDVALLVITGDAPGATLFINGSPLGRLSANSSVELSAGLFEVTIVAPGYRTFSTLARLALGERTFLRYQPERL